MLAVLSPARNIRPVALEGVVPTKALFPVEVMRVVSTLREYSPWQLESLLDVNPERAFELYDGYQSFDTVAPGIPALLAFYGAAFRNMNVQDFTLDDFAFAQAHLRILSALYGLLRPADGILPYRLGIKREFTVDGQELYAFWGERLYRALFQSGEMVVNLTSQEYAKLFTPYMSPNDRMITCRFLVQKQGGARGTVATVRAARGRMARFIIKNRVTRPEGLKAFDWEGYRFIASQSDAFNYVFIQERNDL